ncbi:MAG: AtpZ/AtpI family protein [Janthinobacterium lividum]
MGDPASFEDRLRVARQKQGLDAPVSAGPGGPAGTSALGVGVRVGVELVSALVVAVGLGWLLDRWLHTLPLFLILSVLLGGAAGIANVWRLLGTGGPLGGRSGSGPAVAVPEDDETD